MHEILIQKSTTVKGITAKKHTKKAGKFEVYVMTQET